MSQIGQRVFVLGGNELYLTLSNEEFVRSLSIGNNWTKLRIGIMVAQTPDGTNNLVSCTLTMGMCSGTVYPFNSANTVNWVGVSIPGNLGSTLTYTAGSGNPYFAAGFSYYGKKVGSSTSFTPAGNGALTISSNTGALQRRTPIYLDIEKASPNYKLLAFSTLLSSTNVDVSFMSFLDGCEQAFNATPTITGVTFISSSSAGSPLQVATSEAAGPFDTFSFFWSKTLFPMEVYAIAAYRAQ